MAADGFGRVCVCVRRYKFTTTMVWDNGGVTTRGFEKLNAIVFEKCIFHKNGEIEPLLFENFKCTFVYNIEQSNGLKQPVEV